MGASLLSYWQANPVIVTVAEFHHQANYHGFASEYVWLVYFADQLLAYFKRGDGSLPIEGSIAKKLGLSINESIEITRKILTNLHSDVTSGTASSYSQ